MNQEVQQCAEVISIRNHGARVVDPKSTLGWDENPMHGASAKTGCWLWLLI